MIISELSDHFFDISTSLYGAHVIGALLRHGNTEDRQAIALELLPFTFRLLKHKVGSDLVDTVYAAYSNARMQRAIEAQLWGHFLDPTNPHLPAGLLLDRNAQIYRRMKTSGMQSRFEDEAEKKPKSTPVNETLRVSNTTLFFLM